MKQQMLEEEVRNLKKTIAALTAELDQLYEGLNAWPRSLALATLARAEAAEAERDALIAERDQAIDNAKYNAQYVDLVVHYRNERDAMAAEVKRLREALKPFADEAEYWETWGADDSLVEWFPEYDGNENPITVGDLRNARAALKGDRNE